MLRYEKERKNILQKNATNEKIIKTTIKAAAIKPAL